MQTAFVTLFDDLAPPPGPPPRPRLRERRHKCRRYVRKVKGDKYQVRWWLEGFGSVNCGLYDRATAERVVQLVTVETGRLDAAKAPVYPMTPLGLWQALKAVLAAMRQDNWENLPDPEPLPRYVEAVPGGFAAAVTRHGRAVACPGPYATPEGAYAAIAGEIAAAFPKVRTREAVTLADFLGAAA